MELRWYVCDTDDGVLRVEQTHRDAVQWWVDHCGATRVLRRRSYHPGYYNYVVGHSDEDCSDAAIVREDMLPVYGIDTPPDDITPLHPHID